MPSGVVSITFGQRLALSLPILSGGSSHGPTRKIHSQLSLPLLRHKTSTNKLHVSTPNPTLQDSNTRSVPNVIRGATLPVEVSARPLGYFTPLVHHNFEDST